MVSDGTYMFEDPAGNVHKYGPGFAFFKDPAGDTIVYQTGDNGSFKGFVGYDLTRDNGFVFFTNGFQGDKIRTALQELILGFEEPDSTQYPNALFAILHAYNEQGYSIALTLFNNLVSKDAISRSEFLDISELFINENAELSAHISGIMLSKFKDDLSARVLHAKALMKSHRYNEALADLKKALELDGGSNSNLEKLITDCNKQLASENSVKK